VEGRLVGKPFYGDRLAAGSVTVSNTNRGTGNAEPLRDETDERVVRASVDRGRRDADADRVTVPACDLGFAGSGHHVDLDARDWDQADG
jgi:hypothetical protein